MTIGDYPAPSTGDDSSEDPAVRHPPMPGCVAGVCAELDEDNTDFNGHEYPGPIDCHGGAD